MDENTFSKLLLPPCFGMLNALETRWAAIIRFSGVMANLIPVFYMRKLHTALPISFLKIWGQLYKTLKI